MQASFKSKLTIVLTLKDREAFTRRWMRYMNDQCCPYKILIADGGADEGIESELRNPTNYPNLDYEYIRYPFDNDWKDFYAKQLDVCKRVETEYLLFADNDDFYLIDKIPDIINFLDENPSYSGCRGSIAHLFLLSAEGAVKSSPTGYTYRTERHECKSIESNEFIERAERFFNEAIKYNHWTNWYCILRSKQVSFSLANIYKYSFPSVVLNEILFNLMILQHGKVKTMEKLFYIRQSGTSQGGEVLQKNHNSLESFLIDDAFHCFNKFFQEENLTEGQSNHIRIIKAFASYVGIWCHQCTDQYREISYFRKIKDNVKKIIIKNSVISKIILNIYIQFSHLINHSGKRRSIRTRIIDKYVLDANLHNRSHH